MRNVNGSETEGKPDTQQTKSPSFFQQHLLTYTGNALMGDRRLDMRSIFRVTLYIYIILQEREGAPMINLHDHSALDKGVN